MGLQRYIFTILSLFKHINKFYSLKTISIVFALIEITISIVFGLFPGGSDGKASACNAGDLGSIPGMGRSPGEGNGKPLQNSCLENPMDRGAW